MPTEKSPGLKILWLWTLGTAAILVTSVMRTRMRDMESFLNAQQEEPISSDTYLVDKMPESEDVVREDTS